MVVWFKEFGVMLDGYFGMLDQILESCKNFWFQIGDIGWMDEDGWFYFLYWVSECICVKGEMVFGFEVEEGILIYQVIEDCVVIVVLGEMGEEDIKVFVMLKVG